MTDNNLTERFAKLSILFVVIFFIVIIAEITYEATIIKLEKQIKTQTISELCNKQNYDFCLPLETEYILKNDK